jgi:WhiB family transcriptional regulator, redox-sensing transcriptional regulator
VSPSDSSPVHRLIDPVTTRAWPQASRSVRDAMARHGWAWHARGACGPETAHLFYGPDAQPGTRQRQEARAQRQARVAAAKAICARCPVIAQCRAYALDANEPHGIWGGLTEGERHAVRAVHRHHATRSTSTSTSARSRAGTAGSSRRARRVWRHS